MTTAKFGTDVAEGWSEAQYADPVTYLGRRAELVRLLGPELEPGEGVLDLACGDGALGAFLVSSGLAYTGVDASEAMVAAARRRLGADAEIVHARLDDYRPPGPVAATTVFRAIYYSDDRISFFRRAADYTEKKLVFDLDPRRYRLDEIRSELRSAGFGRLDVRPFFVPQHFALPTPVQQLLFAAERLRPLARALLRVRFSYVCAASRR